MALFAFQLRMRESYRRVVKMWIRFANPWIHFDLICQFSEDSICRFILSYGAQKIHFLDSFRDTIFKRFNESNESSQILSTMGQTNLSESSVFSKDSICGFVSSYGVQKICFVDSFCPKVLKRFVSWIRFVRPKISKNSICFVSDGFLYDSRILNFNLISFL